MNAAPIESTGVSSDQPQALVHRLSSSSNNNNNSQIANFTCPSTFLTNNMLSSDSLPLEVGGYKNHGHKYVNKWFLFSKRFMKRKKLK